MTEQERADLRRKIAEELGYRIVDLNDNLNGMRVKGAHWVIYSPEGKELDRAFTLENLWHWASLHDWTTSINAALTLPLYGKDRLILDISNGAYTVTIDPVNTTQFVVSRKTGDPATLIERIASDICAVWYEYRRVVQGMQS